MYMEVSKKILNKWESRPQLEIHWSILQKKHTHTIFYVWGIVIVSAIGSRPGQSSYHTIETCHFRILSALLVSRIFTKQLIKPLAVTQNLIKLTGVQFIKLMCMCVLCHFISKLSSPVTFWLLSYRLSSNLRNEIPINSFFVYFSI